MGIAASMVTTGKPALLLSEKGALSGENQNMFHTAIPKPQT